MMKILKNKNGMTLIEMIVSMVLFVIVAATVSAILVPMLKVYAKANEFAECNTLLDNIANQIISDLSDATVELEDLGAGNEISITIDNPEDVKYSVDSDSGVLLKNDIPVLTKTYYKNKSVSFVCNSASTDSGTAYTLTVIILSDRHGEMMRRKYVVRPLALNQYQEISNIAAPETA